MRVRPLIFIVLFAAAVSANADEIIHSQGSIPFAYYGYTQRLGGFDLAGTFDWTIEGCPPAGKRDTSILGRLAGDPYINYKFNVEFVSKGFYYKDKGKEYLINDYPELKKVTLFE